MINSKKSACIKCGWPVTPLIESKGEEDSNHCCIPIIIVSLMWHMHAKLIAQQ